MTATDISRFEAAVPSSTPKLTRLDYLLRNINRPPRIAVLGKFNHGKSTLLNAIVVGDRFKTSDTRETVKVARHDHDGVTWIDTPGLDADIGGQDDKAATTAAFREADFLLLVHQVTAGELDRFEITAFHRHARQDKNYRAKILLVLTQIDQLNPDEVDQVTKSIGRQLMAEVDLRDLPVAAVSAVRYGRAIAKNDRRLREVSGMDQLFERVAQAKAGIATRRRKETRRLLEMLMVELDDDRRARAADLRAATHRFEDAARTFVVRLRSM